MKKTILYTLGLVATIATAVFTVFVGCDGDFGERSEKMNAFLNKFGGISDTATITIRYTVTFDKNDGRGNPPAPIVVIKDSSINLPDPKDLKYDNHTFAGWCADKECKVNYGKGGSPYTPKSNVTLYAKWTSIDKVTSNVNVISAGTGAFGDGDYEDGATVNINAGTAPNGQRFKNWTATPAVTFASESSPTTTFTMPRNHVTVTAVFEAIPANKYSVTVSSIGVGASVGGNYGAGDNVTINAGKDPFGHRFRNWTTESEEVIFVNANSRTTSFNMPANAVTVTANFYEVPTFKVTIVSETVDASRDSSYREGDTVTIKAGTALIGKRFKNWTVTEGGVTLGNADSANTKFIMPGRPVAVTANFQEDKYTVTVSAGAGATGGGEYAPGERVTIRAGTSPDDVPFRKWMTSNSNVIFTDANSVTTMFVMPSSAVTVTAVFMRIFTDNRDGQKYGMVSIGGKTWMAENLNYSTSSGSWCYGGSADNCAKYGRLYDWETAKTVCPSGWHLPDTAEWRRLVETAGGSSTAGKKLKSTSGWSNNGNGTDDFGFSALPGGGRGTVGSFNYAGYYGYWWTATESSSGNAYFRNVYYDYDYVYEDYNDVGYGFSVRCRED